MKPVGAHAEDWILGEDSLLRATLRDIRETSVLVRALEWVDSASQDARIARYIQEATASIHPVIKENDDFDQSTVRSISDWYLFTAMQSRGQRGCPPHLVLAAGISEASATLSDALFSPDPVPVSFMREQLFSVRQRLMI